MLQQFKGIYYFYFMFSYLRNIFILLFLSVLSFQAKSTHLIGGYMEYNCLGLSTGNIVQYELKLYLYVDCGPGSNVIIEPAAFTIFDENTGLDVLNSSMQLTKDSILPNNISNPCVVTGPNVCVKEEIYTTTLLLSPNRPHRITYQRCCRNNSIANVFRPDEQGTTLTTVIPAFNTDSCNSSPVFNDFPPISICSGYDVNLDLSAFDPDGDSLVYSLCAPFNYPDRLDVRPIPANPPPYSFIPYLSLFSASNPMPSNPALTLNPISGKLNGTPTTLGQYLLGYCVEEYRNGVLINTTRRDIQVNTGSCDPVITSAIQDQNLFCDGLTVQFQNNSTSNVALQGYKWDFGVLNQQNDTSRKRNPIFTYPDTGVYTITLISNPGLPCTDTSTNDFHVYKKLSPILAIEGQTCIDANNVTFVARGLYEPYASFNWNFGSSANIASSTSDSVTGIIFSGGAGTYPVQLIVSQDECSDTIDQQVVLYPNPTIDFTYSDSAGCYPLPVNFTSLATPNSAIVHQWDFGDGASSSLKNPSHTYLANGFYDVELTIRTTDKCIDTLTIIKKSVIDISLDSSKNKVNYSYTDSAGCYPLPVQFLNHSVYEGNATFLWDFGDGTTSTTENPRHTYTANGYYNVSLAVTTTEKCIETFSLQKDSAIYISLDSSLNEIKFGISPTEACPGTPIMFLDSSFYEGSADYFWDFGNNSLSQLQNPSYTYTDTGYYSVGLLLITKDKCVDTLVLSKDSAIRILPTPTSILELSDSMKPLKHASFSFDGSSSLSNTSSQLYINGVFISNSSIVDYTFTDTGHFTVTQIVQNDFGCFDTTSAIVFVYDEFEFIIPNIFTPNGDRINDEFAVRACGVYEYEIEIFNRYGISVFQSTSMNINWTGRINERIASEGVYFYKIKIKDFMGEYRNYNGALTLIRD